LHVTGDSGNRIRAEEDGTTEPSSEEHRLNDSTHILTESATNTITNGLELLSLEELVEGSLESVDGTGAHLLDLSLEDRTTLHKLLQRGGGLGLGLLEAKRDSTISLTALAEVVPKANALIRGGEDIEVDRGRGRSVRDGDRTNEVNEDGTHLRGGDLAAGVDGRERHACEGVELRNLNILLARARKFTDVGEQLAGLSARRGWVDGFRREGNDH
jgi:hypothetical protein